jgi:peptide/nickel transport system substrate-binding protein
MTAADIPPLDTALAGQQGYEGYRFVGNSLYDGLTKFDLKQAAQIPQIIPDLASSYSSNPDGTVWTFKLRPGVTFHDGTPWNADAAVANFDRYVNPKSTYYSAALAGVAALGLQSIKAYTKVDDMTIQLTTSIPNSHMPSDLATIYMASPTALQKEGTTGFGAAPVGTGPFKFSSVSRGQQLVLLPNKEYWGGAPKVDKLILKPIPDPTARIAALRTGEVNWIEYPTPDSIPALKSSGVQVITNSYDHVWPWILDTSRKPWNDVRVRQAANYAINRPAMVQSLLKGTAEAASQLIPKANAAYNPADDIYNYDPAKAKQLLADAGVPNGFHTTVSIPTSGSGNMVPIPMNEELQKDLAAVGIQVQFKPIEWSAMLAQLVTGKIPDNADAMNISLSFQQESFWPLEFSSKSPINLAHYTNPQVDQFIQQAQSTVDDKARAQLYGQAGSLITKDAVWLFVVNDRNPRALSASVHGFIEPKSWFVDLSTVWVK